MRIRFAKVRITDHRTGRRTSEQAAHDKMVALFDDETLRRMESDLASRRLKFAQSPENRWVEERLEAIRARLARKA